MGYISRLIFILSTHIFHLPMLNTGERFLKVLKTFYPCVCVKQSTRFWLSGDQLDKKEGVLNCCDKKWSSFLCVLGLASLSNKNIYSYYPDCGEQRFKLLVTCIVDLPTFESLYQICMSYFVFTALLNRVIYFNLIMLCLSCLMTSRQAEKRESYPHKLSSQTCKSGSVYRFIF